MYVVKQGEKRSRFEKHGLIIARNHSSILPQREL